MLVQQGNIALLERVFQLIAHKAHTVNIQEDRCFQNALRRQLDFGLLQEPPHIQQILVLQAIIA